MPKVDRLTRVNELIKREIAQSLERYPVTVPGMLASVTEVRTGVDLRNSTVMISVFGGDAAAKQEVLTRLHRFRPDMQAILGRNLGFKHTPVLNFELDERVAKGDNVLELLQKYEDEQKENGE